MYFVQKTLVYNSYKKWKQKSFNALNKAEANNFQNRIGCFKSSTEKILWTVHVAEMRIFENILYICIHTISSASHAECTR